MGAPRVTTREATFEPDSRSVRAARAFVASSVSLPEALEPAVALLVSELAANAVLHARTAFRVRVTETLQVVRVEVTDTGGTMPVVKRYSLEASTGRGLRLIQSMASRWGVEAAPLGKTVWFELDLADPAVARSA